MWISDKWTDYALLDCSGGEKLERWGEQILVRPDPQAIWHTPKTDKRWNTYAGRYHRSESGGGSWEKGKLPQSWQIGYGELRFHVKPMNFKHTGLFPEQAANWDYAMEKIRAAKREIRRGKRYDAIIMDPPSYGRGPSGEIWKLEDSLWPFVSLCAGVLSDDPLFVIINSYTTGLSASVLTYITESIFTKKFGGHSESRELGLRAEVSGLVLPCGATCRWERK